MKLIYFKKEEQIHPGILTDKGIIDIDDFPGSKDFTIANLPALKEIERSATFFIDESAVTITSCCPYPSKIICIGLNYRRHAEESNMPVPQSPVVFSKFSNTLINFQQEVSLGKEGTQFDYEVELGVVIGKECKSVTKATALDYVLGYCVANDLSCRDLQFKTSQWLIGKTLDNFLPLGKYVTTADEISNPQDLQLQCYHNNVLRQNSNTSDMIFSVAEIIEELSKYMTLYPGDLILTGTPEGVIMGLTEKNWLKPNDIVEVSIAGLGATRNKMIR